MVGRVIDHQCEIFEAVLEWLLHSRVVLDVDAYYGNELTAIIQAFWPKREKVLSGGISYFPLPWLSHGAVEAEMKGIVPLNAAWNVLFIAYYLLDKVEDQEIDHPIFKKYRPGVVLNLATGLLHLAEAIMQELPAGKGAKRTVIRKIQSVFHTSVLKVCAGQHLDLTLYEPSLAEAWKIAAAKSGQFFGLACSLGAQLGTQDQQKIDRLTQIGWRLGLLNQISNDLGGLSSPQDGGNDLSVGKHTLPVAYTFHVLPAHSRLKLADLLKLARENRSAEIEARTMIEASGAVIYLLLEAEKYRYQARQSLSELGVDNDSTRALHDILTKSVNTRHHFRNTVSTREA